MAFAPVLRGKNVLIRMDNRVAVSYIQKQGGTKSLTLMEEVRPRAVYVPAAQNMLVDYLSRETLSNNE